MMGLEEGIKNLVSYDNISADKKIKDRVIGDTIISFLEISQI